jgi:hypothetical protein
MEKQMAFSISNQKKTDTLKITTGFSEIAANLLRHFDISSIKTMLL